jgi:uncharacterized coiled-coil DUF342 family protein
MILEISSDLDELLEKIQETTDLLKNLDPVARAVALGVVLSKTIRDDFEEEVDEGSMIAFLMKKAEQIVSAMEELQIEGVSPKPKTLSN